MISGPYLPTHASSEYHLIASSNQQVDSFSEAGERMYEAMGKTAMVRVNIGVSDKSDWLIGVFDQQTRGELHHKLGLNSSTDPGECPSIN